MASEGKYGTITASNKPFHPDEPVFILRATDALAVDTIADDYYERCKQNGCSADHLAAIKDHAERIKKWQRANPRLVKLPD